ncbi:hypothetical protein AP41_04065 [Mycobacterium tuberculosis H3005]|nr:hypothetical protein AP41_04065 [Mycobacterium tuberculosis H3005]
MLATIFAVVVLIVVRPKTPRGDGNQVSNGGGNLAATGRSSDPKPREGTETRANPFGVMRMVGSGRQTQNPERGRKHVRRRRKCPTARVVRPKTPRGDGNMGYLLPARGDAVRGRQTQNPERGRKP